MRDDDVGCFEVESKLDGATVVLVRPLVSASVLVFSAAFACAVATATLSPGQSLSTMRTAAEKTHSVHYVSVESSHGASLTFVADVGAEEGLQGCTAHKGSATGRAVALFSHGKVYARGDAAGLVDCADLTPPQAAQYAGDWILIPRGSALYTYAIGDMTVASTIATLFGPLTQSGQLSVTPATVIDGVSVEGVTRRVRSRSSAAIPLTIMIYAQTTTRLPVYEVVSRGAVRVTLTLSKWNEPVTVSPPKNARPLVETNVA